MTILDRRTAMTAPNQPDATSTPTIAAADAMVRQLESFGVEYIFGTCGHTNIALLDALSRSSIEFVIARHEQAAAHAADGYARLSGKTGVVLMHVGPGMMNGITGVATAAFDSVPLVAIAGDVPSYYYGRHPHQEVNLHRDADQASMYAPFAKRVLQVHRVEDLPRFTERAFWTARSGRPGAVLLNVPMDHFSRQLPNDADSFPMPGESTLPGLRAEDAQRIAELLVAAERPLIYVGGGLRTDDGRKHLLALAEHLDIPMAHSLMAKGTVPDRHPLLMGMTGFWGLEMTNGYTREADVVLAFGTRFAETDSSSWDSRYSWGIPPGKLIQVDLDPNEIGRNYPVEIGVVSDAGDAVTQVHDAVIARTPGPRTRAGLRDRIVSTRTELFDSSRRRGEDDVFPLRPERILRDLRDSIPSDAILVTDVGWNKNGVAQCYDLPDDGRFITPGGLSTMGFGPAAAVGVQVAARDRVVIALVGDGGMSAQLPAIPMAVEQGLPVIFVVMNNRAHGTIADLQASNFGASFGCEFRDPDGNAYSPDFAAVGRACGADGYRPESADDFAVALRDAVQNRRPAVIDIAMVNEPVPTPGHWNIKDIYQGLFD
jgi:acetolactate synthase-1/2/3 large subunit